jgi:integrase
MRLTCVNTGQDSILGCYPTVTAVTFANNFANGRMVLCMRKPTGHIRPHGAGYEVAVPVGRDPITKRYSYAYRQAPTLEEAEKVRDRMLAELETGRKLRDKTTFGQLLDDVLEVAHLDLSTRVIYQGYIERTIRPALGEYEVRYLEQHPELLDRLYAGLGRCRRVCGGRRGPGRAPRFPAG